MKKIFLGALFLSPVIASASEGFTWIGQLSDMIYVYEHILTLIFVGILLTAAAIFYRYKIGKVKDVIIPDKGISFRNFVEAYGNFINGQCKAILGEEDGKKYFTFIATLFIVILLSNLLGLVPGFAPPTGHLSTTFALGVFAFIYYNVIGCKEQGTLNYLKHFAGPLWYMAILIFPIEIISNFIRPLSLALRLKGNMMGDHLVLSIFSDLVPFAIPMIFYLLGLLVCVIQAYVFIMLTMVYISLATSHHDQDEHEAH